MNIIAFNVVGKSTADDILNENTKHLYDYYMIIVLLISWVRFFSYFLVINRARLGTLFRKWQGVKIDRQEVLGRSQGPTVGRLRLVTTQWIDSPQF